MMGTYDTRGGTPISPNDPEPIITDAEAEVLAVLEELDRAKESAVAVLEPIFLAIVAQRYPVGSIVDIKRMGRALKGRDYGYRMGKVLRLHNDHFDYVNPEMARVAVVVRLMKGDVETKHELTIWTEVVSVFSARKTRDELCRLICNLLPESERAAFVKAAGGGA